MDKDTEKKDDKDEFEKYEQPEDSFSSDDEEYDVDDADEIEVEQDPITLSEEELKFDDFQDELDFLNEENPADDATQTSSKQAAPQVKQPSKLVTGALTAAVVLAITYYGFISTSDEAQDEEALSKANAVSNLQDKLDQQEKIKVAADKNIATDKDSVAVKQENPAQDAIKQELNDVVTSETEETSKSSSDAIVEAQAEVKPVEDKVEQDLMKQEWQATEDRMIKEISALEGDVSKNISNAVDIEDVLSTLEEFDQKDRNRSEKLENLIRSLTKQVHSNQRKIDTVVKDSGKTNKLLQEVVNEIRSTSNTSANTNKTEMGIPSATKVIKNTPKFDAPSFTVYAVIPGRAWLKNKEGDILTVTEGDILDTYGKILAIDAPSNTVVTSSGVVIR